MGGDAGGWWVVGGWVVGWLVVVGDDVGDVVVFSRVLSSFNVVLGGW